MKKINFSVIDAFTNKPFTGNPAACVVTEEPLDEKTILEWTKKTGAVVTVEEHQVLGGLGGAVAELLAKKNPVPMEFIGMQDTFGESGTASELIDTYEMGVKDIILAVKKVIRRK
jgi:transketolase